MSLDMLRAMAASLDTERQRVRQLETALYHARDWLVLSIRHCSDPECVVCAIYSKDADAILAAVAPAGEEATGG